MDKKIRTVNTAFEEIKTKDPHTAITKNAIRNLLASGVIPSLKVGTRTIFDLNDLEAYINSEMYNTAFEKTLESE